MDITKLIVDLLEKGQKVEIPGIGTLDSVTKPPYHDPNTNTFYPESRTVAFSSSTTGDNSIIQALATSECVSENLARQMWLNYVDALTDKIKSSGSHTFGHLGTLTCSGGKTFGFSMADGVVLQADNNGATPLADVKTYAHDDEEDPFAQFDDVPISKIEADGTAVPIHEPPLPPIPEHEPEPKSEPETMPEPEPETMPEPKPEPEQPLTDTPEGDEEMPEAIAVPPIDKKRQRAEQKAEAERMKAEEKAEAERMKAEEKAEAERKKAEQKAEAERKKAEQKAEAERIKAEREKAKSDQKAAERARKENERQGKEALKKAQAQEKALRKEEKEKQKEDARKQGKGRKRSALVPILIILLIMLILGGGAYYFLVLRKATPLIGTPTAAGHLRDIPATNSLTYNCDMIDYSPRDITIQRDKVCRFMNNYINNYLASRNFGNAKVPMMDRVRQYTQDRLETLLGERFAVQRLIPYDDYIYRYNEPYLKEANADNARVAVQSELMDYGKLDDMLYRLADELGLQPGNGGQATASDVRQVKEAERNAAAKKKEAADQDNTRSFVYLAKGSKKGFDVIAGFYLNKETAGRLTARLHEQGCDAYIIEFNDLYYVSMGSAATQTAAEALMKHIKEWYDGDVVVKQL